MPFVPSLLMKSSSRTEALLEFLFWNLDKLSRPTFRNVTESFEAWEYRHKIRPRLRSLHRSGLITCEKQGGRAMVTVTAKGRLAAAGGVDPIKQWERSWDGKWRVVVFDLPGQQWTLRRRLWQWLRSQRFGCLQQSVWLSPDPVDDSLLPLRSLKLTPESYTVIEGRPVGSDTDTDLVRSAWDFKTINRIHAQLLELSDHGIRTTSSADTTDATRRRWMDAYRKAWIEALSVDPLLPRSLWLPDYAGEQVWRKRGIVFTKLMRPGR